MKDREEALRELARAVESFCRVVAELPEERFLTRMNGWTPRDVVAHLVGWNRMTIEGSNEILRGEAPAYLDDVDADFRHVNAASVKVHAETARDLLLSKLTDTAKEVRTFVRELDPDGWRASIRFRRWTISVADCVDGLQQDYDVHRERIEAWAAGLDRQGGKDR